MTTAPAPVEHNLGQYISKAFELYMKDPVNWIIIGLVGTLALGVGQLGGFHICAEKAWRGEKPTVSDVLIPFQRIGEWIVPVLLLAIGGGILVLFCGVGLLVILYFSILWAFAWPLMYLRNMPWSQAKDLSSAIGKQALVPTFILVFVAGLIGGLGGVISLPFLTAPLTGMIMVQAFWAQFGGGPDGSAAMGQIPPQPQIAPAAMGAPPAAPPTAAPGAGAWGAPPAATPDVQAQAAAWGAPPTAGPDAQAAAWGDPPAAAPSVQPTAAPAWAPPSAPPAAGGTTETAQQSTTDNPDEAYSGKTMAMSSVDFEEMMRKRNNADG
jgi:hypothetical protein